MSEKRKWYCTHKCVCKHPETICNMCGESCSLSDDKDCPSFGGLINQVVSGGYNSTPGNGNGALDDTVDYKFSLCEFCLDWLFTTFKIAPTVYQYTDGEYFEFKPAGERVATDEWRKQKSKFLEEWMKRNMLRKVKLYCHAPIAQLAEQRILNSFVVSSNLARGTMIDQEVLICNKCGKRILSSEETVNTAYPDMHHYNVEVRESLEKLFNSFETSQPKPQCENYHVMEYYTGQGGERSSYLCGPLRPETQEEYYVHIAGSNMRR